MERDQAKSLGSVLRRRRTDLGLSTPQVARASGQTQATVVRIEQGQFLNPDPDKLRALAEALDLNLADVLSLAGYPIPTELPSVGPYLRTRYPNVPATTLQQVQREVAAVLKRHGIKLNNGPGDGEDELPDNGKAETG